MASLGMFVHRLRIKLKKSRKKLKKLAKQSSFTTMKKNRTVYYIRRSKKALYPFPL